MILNKKSLEELISAADKIIAANKKEETDLFGEVNSPKAIREIMDLEVQDPDKSHERYYDNIQRFLREFLPIDSDISKVIREEVCILLSHKERTYLTSGARHADSRMATAKDMEYIIEVLSEWSATPTDFFKLANLLLIKCKELGYIPEDRELSAYIR